MDGHIVTKILLIVQTDGCIGDVGAYSKQIWNKELMHMKKTERNVEYVDKRALT